MKKNFIQPGLMVVRMNNHDIITDSTRFSSTATSIQLGADRIRDDWDAGY